MTKSLRSFPKSERHIVSARRIKSNSRGLGYWAAFDRECPSFTEKGYFMHKQSELEQRPTLLEV